MKHVQEFEVQDGKNNHPVETPGLDDGRGQKYSEVATPNPKYVEFCLKLTIFLFFLQVTPSAFLVGLPRPPPQTGLHWQEQELELFNLVS